MAISFQILTLAQVTGETHNKEKRKKVYETADIIATTCRVFVVDALDGTLDATKIDVLLLNDAHRALENSPETFAVRVLRDANPRASVKATSEDADACIRGFAKLTKIATNLDLERVGLWPRFQVHVAAELEKNPPHVLQLKLPSLSSRGQRAFTAVLVALDTCFNELKKLAAGNQFLDIPGSASMAITTSSEKEGNPFSAVDGAVAGVLYQNDRRGLKKPVPPRARQLAVELKALRDLADAMPRYDGAAAYDAVLTVRDLGLRTGRNQSDWAGVALDELVVASRERIDEPAPKWRLVVEAVDEVKKGTIVIVCRDASDARGVRDVLAMGSEGAMDLRRLKLLEKEKKPNLEDRLRASVVAREAQLQLRKGGDDRAILICSASDWRRELDPLGDWRPKTVILVDAEPEFIRDVEVYASRCAFKVTAYVLVCGRTAEEATYAAALEKETSAFQTLVREKELMLVPKSARREAIKSPGTVMPTEKRNPIWDPPKRRKKEETETPSIVVDSREFRSQLPLALYTEGAVVRPATIAVGDYVLAPDIVVERKSLVDLVGSLRSGRLYQQAENMQRKYQTPVLLVETTGSIFGTRRLTADKAQKKFQSSSHDDDEDELAGPTSTEARFALLAMAYPRLRVLWCGDDKAAVKVFASLKRGRPQPVVENNNKIDDGRNIVAIDLLKKLPGITEGNVHEIIQKVDNLRELATMSVDQLAPLIGRSNAKLLYVFLHHEDVSQLPSPDTVTSHLSRKTKKPSSASQGTTSGKKPRA